MHLSTHHALGAVVGALILFAGAPADAKRRSSSTEAVKITSRPAGAVVTTDSGQVLGRTPIRARLPRGTHILLIERDGYATLEYAIEVVRKRRANRFKFRLDKTTSIQVMLSDASSDIEGAQVFVDGKKVGFAPHISEVSSGPHSIQVRKRGYVTYEEWVEVKPGLNPITAHLESETIGGPPPETQQAPLTSDKPSRTSTQRSGVPLVYAGGGLEFGGRRFRYDNPGTVKMRDFDAGGVPLVRFSAQVFPLARRSSNKALAGLSVDGSFAKGAPVNSNTSDGQIVGTGLGDFSLGFGLRVPLGRKTLAGKGLDVGGRVAYGRQYFGFDQMNELAAEVPDVEYRFFDLGAQVGSQFKAGFRAFGAASLRVVNTSGVLGRRFSQDSALGMGVRAGLTAQVTPSVDLQVAGNVVRYGHTFAAEDGAEFIADGASDLFFGLNLGAVYRY